MADQKPLKSIKSNLSEQERLTRLVYEIQRSALVWNHFAGTLIDGWYPGRNRIMGAEFKGSDRERIEQLFKIRDYETRRTLNVLRELGIEQAEPNYGEIYDELSAATDITSTSHKRI